MLTPHERQILSWVGPRKDDRRDRGGSLGRTVHRAEARENIYAKLGLHTRTAAVMRYLSVLDDEERQVLT